MQFNKRENTVFKGNFMKNSYIGKEGLRFLCPVCGEAEHLDEIFFRDFSGAAGIVPFLSYKVYGCQKCGVMYAGKLKESQNIGAYYTKMSRYEGNSFVLSEKVKRFYARVAKFLASQVSKSSRVLDIGCAFGGQLAALKEQGFINLFGLEPSEKNAKYAMDNYGIKVFNGGLGMGFEPTDKYDLVILSGVLEHLVELHSVIDEIKGFMNTGGKLFLVVPDLDDFANHSDLYQEFSVEHINYFNISSLSYLLGRHGFGLNSSLRDSVALHGLCRNLLALFELRDDFSQEVDTCSSFEAMKKYLQVSNQVADDIATKIKKYSFEYGCYIWGAGTQTQMLFQLGLIKPSDVQLVIDANPNYHGEAFYGTHIVAPEVLLEGEPLPILISSQYAQNAIEKQIKAMNLKNEVWKLF